MRDADAGGNSRDVGIVAGDIDFEVSPLLIDFGMVSVGSPAPAETFQVENTGDVPFEFPPVVPGQPFLPSVFEYAILASDVLQPGETGVVSVVFSPTDPGAVNSVVVLRLMTGRGGTREVAVEFRGTGTL